MENQHRKISGYRELDQADIDLMNTIKAQGPVLEHLIAAVRAEGGDQRWAAIAQTHFQEGLMALTRAIAKPEFF